VSNTSVSRELYLVDSRGGKPKQLTFYSGFQGGPSVSPDGRYIVFRSDQTVKPHIWRMDIDGGNPKQLTDGYAPHVSPDSQWVAYVYTSSGSDTIWKVSIDGGQPVQLSDKETNSPLFSPDGKQIACFYREEPSSALKIAILPFEGREPIKTFALPTGFVWGNLRWTMDGRALVYTVTSNGVSNLWAQPVDGSPLKQLTNFTSDLIFWFDFSRDGKQLALSRGTQTSDVVLISDFKQ
jgi:TolB protein